MLRLIVFIAFAFALWPAKTVDATCYGTCESANPAGTSEFDNDFCCPGIAHPPDCIWFDGESQITEEYCADRRIDYLDNAGAVVSGPTLGYSVYALEVQTYRYNIFYGECVGDHCVWTADPGNTFSGIDWGCVDCPI